MKPGQSLLVSTFITIVIADMFRIKLVKMHRIGYRDLGFLV